MPGIASIQPALAGSLTRPLTNPEAKSRLRRLSLGALALFTTVATPSDARAQIEITAGVLVVPDDGIRGTRVGPAFSIGASMARLRVPLHLEAGAGRVDFTSLGQAYHDNHYFMALGFEWALRKGATSLGLRLGIGGYGEYQIVETNPPRPGGDSWSEMLLPGITLTRELGSERLLVVSLSDAVLGPFNAVLDPEESSIQHRLRLMLGLRF